MPNTTNFNWPTPADTDLVKDGAAAIRNLGNGIDTSLIDLKGGTTGQILSKASNADMDFTFITPNVGDITEVQAGAGISIASGTGPIPVITNSSTDLITTAGDILYGTAADTVARLGIGTAGQFLKVNSGATAPEWAAIPNKGVTKIAAASFTTQSTVTVDSVFSSTYTRYFMRLNLLGSSGGAQPQLQLRYSTSTQSANYSGSGFSYDRANSLTTFGYVNQAQFRIDAGLSAYKSEYLINFGSVGNSSEEAHIWGNGYGDYANQSITSFAGLVASGQTYTGFLLKASAGTITGSYAIYGLEN